MAFIKTHELETQESGNYWRLIEVNDNAERGSVATLQLYKSKTARQADAQPMNKALQFVFTLAEIEDMIPDENLPEGWRDVWYHCHYLAIRAAIDSGAAKPADERNSNERIAEVLHGAENDY